MFLLFHTALLKLKCFIYSRVDINNSCRTYQELGQGDFYSFNQESSRPFNLFSTYPQKKCSHKENHTYPNLFYSISHRVDIYRFVKSLNSFLCCYF